MTIHDDIGNKYELVEFFNHDLQTYMYGLVLIDTTAEEQLAPEQAVGEEAA
jgi:hypothetical protein